MVKDGVGGGRGVVKEEEVRSRMGWEEEEVWSRMGWEEEEVWSRRRKRFGQGRGGRRKR